MSQIYQGGQGLGLPSPNRSTPFLGGTFSDAISTNGVTLPPGGAFILPAGPQMVTLGPITVLQYLDPVTQTWVAYQNTFTGIPTQVHSDGVNFRLFNPTGTVIGAVVTNAGTSVSGLTSAQVTVTAASGGASFTPIIGGAISTIPLLTISSVAQAGSGYRIAPRVIISAPPAPGVQATAYATISGGSVTGITLTNQGAGYPATTTGGTVYATCSVYIAPSPYDPNIGNIVAAAAGKPVAAGDGTLTAVLVPYQGSVVSSAPALTVAGAGSGAAATAIWCQTCTSVVATAAGSGYSTLLGTLITSVGGAISAVQASTVLTNPAVELGILTPRPMLAPVTTLTASSSGIVAPAVATTGLFSYGPTAMVLTGATPAAITTAATIALTMGSKPDTSFVQPI